MLLGQVWMMHPNGSLPAYEWEFGDVNPPVHAWAALRVYENDRRWNGGVADTAFLERMFHKLLLNFTWWVNRKDRQGLNIFEGGFLGLDNVGIFDRSSPLPGGGYLEQSDGTAWMAMYCVSMLHIALELSDSDQVYEDMAAKFVEHLLYIAEAMTGRGTSSAGLWDETDNFYYDKLCMPDGSSFPMRIRSVVGLIPLFVVAVVDGALLRKLPGFGERLQYLHEQRSDLASLVSRWDNASAGGQHLLSLMRVLSHDQGAGADARRERVPVAARGAFPVASLPRPSVRVRMRGDHEPAEICPGRIRFQHVRRQFQLARPGLVSDQFPAGRKPAELPRILWRRLSD